MDEIKKALRKQPRVVQLALKKIFDDILRGKTENYDVVKLVGMKNIFRVRKGNFRIIFRKVGTDFEIVRITTRDDKTYKKLS